MRLSPAQEDLWVYESLYPEAAALNLCCAYHFDEPVDVHLMETALTIVQQHHDALRMRITGDIANLRMSFPPAGTSAWNGSTCAAAARPWTRRSRPSARRTFTLDAGRLFRGQLVTVNDRRSTLVLAMHHIVTDWWSFDVFHSDFSQAYQALRAGDMPRLRPSPITYAELAAWQRELEESGVLDAQLDYWRRYLSGLPAPLTVGAATVRPGSTPRIERVPVAIDARTARAVRAFAREHGTTAYGVLITAFAVFAFRLSGQQDLLLGTPVSNRSERGVQRLIGYVMNTLPTRWQIGELDAFADLLGRFAHGFGGLLANGDVPLGRIVTAVDAPRVADRPPLVQWVFMHLARQSGATKVAKIAEQQRVHTGGEHDVVGVTWDTADGIGAALNIRADIYPPEVVRHWADCFGPLLERLIAEPNVPVGLLPITGDRELGHVLGMAGRLETGLPAESVADVVARQAVLHPGSPALESRGLSLSYAQLLDRADSLASGLREHGLRPGQLVALVLHRSADLIVAFLAVQRAGGVCLPLDPDYPQARLQYLLEQARPELIVTAGDTAGRRSSTSARVLVLENMAMYSASGQLARPDVRQAGYVMFTSGSTGRPRAVLVGRSGVANLTSALVGRMALGPGTRVLQLASPSFDISVGEMCLAFGAGGTLVVPPPGQLSGDDLGDFLEHERIGCVFAPPSVLASVPYRPLPDLHAICTGGETCPPGLAADWTRHDGWRRFHNVYGPTETTVVVSVSPPIQAQDGALPIGLPAEGTRLYVLDARLRCVPIGVAGELYVEGDAIALGYLGQPGPTAERFVADPFSAVPGARMYRTGDIVRWRHDGQLDFVRRADDQVKLRGNRIEPGEVEAVLVEHHGVAQAAVAVVPAQRDGRGLLVAYIVPAAGRRLDQRAVLEHAMATLPAYMVPNTFVEMDKLPLTAHGKLDRDSLPVPSLVPTARGASSSSPQEQLMCGLFASVLGLSSVSLEDDFFSLGGDSIAALLLVSRARTDRVRFTARQVFVARTPAALAAQAQFEAAAAMVPDGNDQGRFDATPIMCWWRDQPGDLDDFATSATFTTPPACSAGDVQEALTALAGRHGALRMRLVRQEGAWKLDILPPRADPDVLVMMQRADAAGLDDDQLREEARRIAASTRVRATEGMVAATWLDRGHHLAGRLAVTIHHLAVDALSWRILGRELTELLTGHAVPTPPTTSFLTWAHYLQLQAPARAGELKHWRSTLSGTGAGLAAASTRGSARRLYTTSLAADRAVPPLTDARTAFRWSEDIFMAALYAAAIRWRAAGTRLLVAVERHGREAATDDLDLSQTVGWFTSIHPVCLDAGDSGSDAFWHGGAEARRTLLHVRDELRRAPDNGIGYGILRYLNSQTGPELAQLPEPDISFNYLGKMNAAANADSDYLGLARHAVLPMAHALQLDVSVNAGTGGPRVQADWSYSADAIAEDEMVTLAGYWLEALGILASQASDGGVGGPRCRTSRLSA